MNKVGFPDIAAWAALYKKYSTRLVNSLNGRYCLADREDAVEWAFEKLMYRKAPEAYGDRMPQTESGWFWALRWQAKSYLSHLKDRAQRHAKYVEDMAKELEGVFVPGLQGLALDADTQMATLLRALEIFKSEHNVSDRDLKVFVLRQGGRIPSKTVAARCRMTVDNVDVTKHRIGKLLRKYGPDCYARALRRAA